jgi:hypothetical protein
MKKTTANICVFLLLVSSFISCNKKDEFISSNFPYYFTGKVNGQIVKFEAEETSARYECDVTGFIDNSGSNYDIYEGTMLQDKTTPNKNQIKVMLLKYFNHYPDYQSEVTTMIQPGNYAYGFGDASSNTVNGAVIYYTDANGLQWYSEGPQDGSSFKVTEVTSNSAGTSVKIFTAQFSCKLHNGTAATLEIKNATVRGKVFP